MDVTAQNPSLTRAQNDGVDEELDRAYVTCMPTCRPF